MGDVRMNSCPACGRRISAYRALLGNEKFAFRCKGCDTRLVKKTVRFSLIAVCLLIFWRVENQYGWAGWQTWATIAAVFAFTGVYALTLARVRLAGAGVEDPPPPYSPSRPPPGPPSLDPHFRGSKGPPP